MQVDAALAQLSPSPAVLEGSLLALAARVEATDERTAASFATNLDRSRAVECSNADAIALLQRDVANTHTRIERIASKLENVMELDASEHQLQKGIAPEAEYFGCL